MLGFWLKGAYYDGMFQKNGYFLAKPVDDSAIIEMERQKWKHKMLTSKSGGSLSLHISKIGAVHVEDGRQFPQYICRKARWSAAVSMTIVPASCTSEIICIEDLIRGNETRARESDLKDDDDDDTVMVRVVLSRSKMSFEYRLQPRLNPSSNTNDV